MKQRSRTALFLMEFLIMLLVFSLTSVVCLRAFALSNEKLTAAENLRGACGAAQNAAERYRSDGGAADPLTQCFDENWNSTTADTATFFLTETETDGSVQIAVTDASGTVLFELEVKAVMADG